MSGQAPSTLVMVRPHRFAVNPLTADDNAFQTDGIGEGVARAARDEVTAAVAALRAAGVTVLLFEDEGIATPDSVFPNNWFSTHPGGEIVLYPMRAPNRRGERRADVVEALREAYAVSEVIDLSPREDDGRFLEGTGSLVIDHAEGVAYAARSGRTDEGLVRDVCGRLGLEPVLFDAAGPDGAPIYHTNVMMSVGDGFALLDEACIADPSERRALRGRLAARGAVVTITPEQTARFAGNALAVTGTGGQRLALSRTAWGALRDDQRAALAEHAAPLVLSVPTIERSGGSVRCMLAGVHLPRR